MQSRTAYVFMVSAVVLLLASCLMSACNRSVRSDTLRASLLAVNAARDGFAVWDLMHQHLLVESASSREAATLAVDDYRRRREVWIQRFEVAYRALALAATQNDDTSLQGALSSAADIIGTIGTITSGATP